MSKDETDAGGFLIFPRKVAVGLLFSLIAGAAGQSGAFIWYAAKLDSRVGALEQADQRILGRGDERFRSIDGRLVVLERDRDRLTRVEEGVGFIRDAVREVSAKLDAGSRRAIR